MIWETSLNVEWQYHSEKIPMILPQGDKQTDS